MKLAVPAPLFTTANCSGILRNAVVSRSCLPAVTCLPFSPAEVVEDPGQDCPASVHFAGSPRAPLIRAWCQQREIKLSGVSIFVPTYSLREPTPVLPLAEMKLPEDSTTRSGASWGRVRVGGSWLAPWMQIKRVQTPPALSFIRHTSPWAKGGKGVRLD